MWETDYQRKQINALMSHSNLSVSVVNVQPEPLTTVLTFFFPSILITTGSFTVPRNGSNDMKKRIQSSSKHNEPVSLKQRC